jgi:hypothetical protein
MKVINIYTIANKIIEEAMFITCYYSRGNNANDISIVQTKDHWSLSPLNFYDSTSLTLDTWINSSLEK